MAEYIDIDAPIDVAVYQRNRRIQVTLRQILESNDAKYERADVRPVVLCENCQYCIKKDNFEYWCNGFCSPARLVCHDDFCSRGRKKDEPMCRL